MPEDAAAAVAGLDALETPTSTHRAVVAAVRWPPGCRRSSRSLLFLAGLAARLGFGDHATSTRCRRPADVWHAVRRDRRRRPASGRSSGPSISRAFARLRRRARSSRTPLGLLVAKVRVVRAAIGPLLSGPADPAVGGLGPRRGALVRPDRRHDLLRRARWARSRRSPTAWWPASTRSRRSCRGSARCSARAACTVRGTSCCPPRCPGICAGCKQGWAFSWRSLMAAEIIAAGPLLGFGLGALPQAGQRLQRHARGASPRSS